MTPQEREEALDAIGWYEAFASRCDKSYCSECLTYGGGHQQGCPEGYAPPTRRDESSEQEI